MRVIFFGTPNFVLAIPQAILEMKGFPLVAVVTNPDRPVGKKQILTSSPVKLWAQKNKIPVIDLGDMSQIIKQVQALKADVGVLAAYGKILPRELIDLFSKGILVIHPSLLPAWRGASPAQAAIAAGDKETGVTIIQMDEKMDHGPIVAQFKEQIKPNDTAESLYQRLSQLTARLLPDILSQYLFSSADRHQKKDVQLFLPPKSQDHSKATFCKILKKEDGQIDWQKTPEEIERFIRAMTPWPGAWTLLRPSETSEGQAKRLKILKAHLEGEKLVIDQVQLEGKKPVSWKQFQQGRPKIKLRS